jgi:ABC-type uncharacterized transport system permease subunit
MHDFAAKWLVGVLVCSQYWLTLELFIDWLLAERLFFKKISYVIKEFNKVEKLFSMVIMCSLKYNGCRILISCKSPAELLSNSGLLKYLYVAWTITRTLKNTFYFDCHLTKLFLICYFLQLQFFVYFLSTHRTICNVNVERDEKMNTEDSKLFHIVLSPVFSSVWGTVCHTARH